MSHYKKLSIRKNDKTYMRCTCGQYIKINKIEFHKKHSMKHKLLRVKQNKPLEFILIFEIIDVKNN